MYNKENKSIRNKVENIKFVQFIDKHCFTITLLIGCFYTFSTFFEFIYLFRNLPFIMNMLSFIYPSFLLVYFLFFLGLSIILGKAKFILNLFLGFIIGMFTCGGVALSIAPLF